MFNLRDLELLVAVIDEGSITAGATRVGISLSSASTRLTAMERTHGVALLHRMRHGVHVTETGELVARQARRVLTEAQELEVQVSSHQQRLGRQLRLASNTSAVDTLTEFLAATLTRMPDVSVVLHETRSPEAIAQVEACAVDMAVVSAPPGNADLVVRTLWADPLMIVRTPGPGRRRRQEPITFRDILDGPMIGLTEGNPLQRLIDEQARLLGASPDYRVRLPTLGAVHAVASTGAGAAVIPAGTARRLGSRPSVLHPMTEKWAQRHALLITRPGSQRIPSQTENSHRQEFIDSLLRYRSEVTD